MFSTVPEEVGEIPNSTSKPDRKKANMYGFLVSVPERRLSKDCCASAEGGGLL